MRVTVRLARIGHRLVRTLIVIIALPVCLHSQPTYAGPKVAPAQFSGDLRNLPQVFGPIKAPHALRNEDEPPEGTKLSRAVLPVKNVALAPMPAPLQNFAGLNFADLVTGGQAGAGWPPDINGAVGRNHYIQ